MQRIVKFLNVKPKKCKTNLNFYEIQQEKLGLTRTGRLLAGMMNDIQRKRTFYLSDFKDAASVQTLASFIFIYFACLTPIVNFGGLLGDATGN